MIVRKIRPEEFKRTEELFSVAFEFPYDCDQDERTRYHEKDRNPQSREDAYLLEKYAAFEDDDETMTGCVSALRFPMNFDGETVLMAGIGGVSSLPQYRRRGGIRGCFTAMLPDLYREKVLFSYLYPFSTAYYRKFGYEMGCRGVEHELKLAFIPNYGTKGSCILAEPGNRAALAWDVRSAYELWKSRYNLMICNESWEYRFLSEADPFKKQEYTYLYRNENGTVTGFMTFVKVKKETQQKLICSRFIYTDTDALKGLLELAGTFASDHVSITFTLPENCELEPLLPELSFGACSRQLKNLGMIRVINVQQVLYTAVYRGSGELQIQVTDDLITENNAVFHVVFENGAAVSVERVDSENAAVQVRMKISEFSRYIAGCSDPSTMLLNPEIIIDCRMEEVTKVFYRKNCFIMEYF
ncbi:MAG: GNAT family N-acetyltransferase [Butyrivibrio sp.]|jgi:predicted acetyltransferase|nr:GNAT family N-acetyltransferase [Butyrivibrio sp.]